MQEFRWWRPTARAIATWALLGVAGCSVERRVAPVDRTFLEDVDVSTRLETLPYGHSWVLPAFDGRTYSKIYLKPIRTDLLPESAWMNSASSIITSREDYVREAGEIAKYLGEQFVQALQNYPGNRFSLVDRGGPDVLTIEMVLTELEFSHPVARAASLAVPVPGSGAALSAMSDPHVAFAARIKDGSGRLVATAADRKFPPARILDLNKLTVTSSAREVCALWAETFAEALNKGRFLKTEGSSGFSLTPW